MPIYEYECSQCAHRIEVLQKISEAPLQDCPACKKPSLRRLVSAASFRLKGTGWYETDFKNKGQSKPAGKQEKQEGVGNSKGDAKSDTSTSGSKPESREKPAGEKK
uniref:Putative regulatory protein, FmdB family n=1 Tax=Candidatus Kentrum sp. FM TaxID=2126340 RepID=A0A450VW99_9GAMM|nr:MAG: putative regulatory protein, FmdB family [Candidatus Kentron sp. FM]VFJ55561.1 MAG: putative regulatory protein, FmdB family [Candidatus Kentron sp. FM]VFK08976.1 MAG: putative regulatory protein, FmdB family [Candidatus Kentron sp. FM]